MRPWCGLLSAPWEKRDSEREPPALKLPQPLWDLGRPGAAAPDSRGPLATLTYSSLTAPALEQLIPAFAPAPQQDPAWAERSQAIGPSACHLLCGLRLPQWDPERQPGGGAPRQQPPTPALPQPTEEGAPRQVYSRCLALAHIPPSKEPAQHPHSSLCRPAPGPPLDQLPCEDRHPGTPLVAVTANQRRVHSHA